MAEPVTLAEIHSNFALLEDWQDKYAYLIDLGKQLPPMPTADKTPEHKVNGCVSQVWLTVHQQAGRVQLALDSDAHIVRGLCALVYAAYHDQPVAVAKQVDMGQVFEQLGLGQHLSPNRRNGFVALVNKVQGSL